MPYWYVDCVCPFYSEKRVSANLPEDSIEEMMAVAKTGVYYGYAQVIPPPKEAVEFGKEELGVLPMVMSVGHNPFYGNNKLTAVRQRYIEHMSLIKTLGNSHHAFVQPRFLRI